MLKRKNVLFAPLKLQEVFKGSIGGKYCVCFVAAAFSFECLCGHKRSLLDSCDAQILGLIVVHLPVLYEDASAHFRCLFPPFFLLF